MRVINSLLTLLKTFKDNRSLNSCENGLEIWMAKSGLLCIYYTVHIALVMVPTGHNKICNVIMRTGVFFPVLLSLYNMEMIHSII